MAVVGGKELFDDFDGMLGDFYETSGEEDGAGKQRYFLGLRYC